MEKIFSFSWIIGIYLLTSQLVYSIEPFFIPAGPVSQPSDWSSSDKENVITESSLELVDSIKTSNWLSAPLTFEIRKLYRYSFKVFQNGEKGNVCACGGTSFFNYDYSDLGDNEDSNTECSEVFFVPDGDGNNVIEAPARLAKWESQRTYCFSLPEVTPVQPIFQLLKNQNNKFLAIGEGESIEDDGTYRFSIFSGPEKTNYNRPLISTTSSYNTNRWDLVKDSEIVYRLALDPVELFADVLKPCDSIPFVAGSVTVNIGFYQKGKLVIEASRDKNSWIRIGETSGISNKEFSLDPIIVDKPSEIFIRLRGEELDGDEEGCHLQIYGFSASLKTELNEKERFVGRGQTFFAELLDEKPLLLGQEKTDALLWGVDENEHLWGYENETRKAFELTWDSDELVCVSENKNSEDWFSDNRIQGIEYQTNFRRPMRITRRIYPYFEQTYTKGILGVWIEDKTESGIDLSWCEADYKVPQRPITREIQNDMLPTIVGAKNDVESFQIILHTGDKPLDNVKAVIVEELKNENGNTIPLEKTNLRYAYYHYIDKPTDSTCAPGWYPDALIPFEQGMDGVGTPLSVLPNQNLPIWVTVKADNDIEPGTYRGSILLTANAGDFSATIPFAYTVCDFALPVKNTLDTAYGLSYSNIDRYHNLKTEEDKRKVYEMYFKLFSDYRISMFDPTPLDSIKVEWNAQADPPCCDIDFSRFDKEIKRVFSKYNFTNFSLPFLGLGGGTYQSRYEGSILGFSSGSSEYESMLSDYGQKIQEHLEELGVLDAAYIYCFDEPEEKDYDFVAGEFAKLKRFAPKIKRMLTEEPSKEFSEILNMKNASIDIWCPVSPNYSDELSAFERENGNRFWWYVCCFPKSPFCTEFTDHPAIELRLWHWQAFERNISGCLIWSGNYWTSSTAFPDSFQNPYEDPACYVTDYSYPPGTKSLWGNGDGRFVYPPLAAAVPGRNDGLPVYDAPCASIRWEMIREGVEDYEMLTILKNLLKEKKGGLTHEEEKKYSELLDFSSFIKDMTHFCYEPSVLRARRLAVMYAIVELQKIN